MNTSSAGGTTFSESEFTNSGTAVRRAQITFANPDNDDRFAIDNLAFQVPEPATAWLMTAGLFASPHLSGDGADCGIEAGCFRIRARRHRPTVAARRARRWPAPAWSRRGRTGVPEL